MQKNLVHFKAIKPMHSNNYTKDRLNENFSSFVSLADKEAGKKAKADTKKHPLGCFGIAST
ncbi:hypothetical protein OKIT_1090 [Oenococcus kitaharae DSM 17330]|uniref:Uncharacterized protein n=1 Tax=Oenococcus kitaharae DSM 17330 TaxID=1045004 RepID=G9WI68_9LACO|nr:hypothetical protein OKIT_1090 [Oenococcus kitaharae DSM 17330]